MFGRADWLMYDVELEGMRSHLQDVADHARGEGSEPDPLVEEELALLERFKAAPDKLARGVDLFPTPGVSPGACGLLVVPAQLTIAICGDAIVGREYFENGRIYEQCADVEDCDACSAAGLACATYYTQLGVRLHCVSTPKGCDAEDCECMGVCRAPYVCGSGGLACDCPVC